MNFSNQVCVRPSVGISTFSSASFRLIFFFFCACRMSDMTSSSPSPFIPHQRSCYRFKEMLTASKSRATGGGREEDGRRTPREGQVCKIWQLSINQVWKTMKRTGENKRPLFALGSLQMNVICRSPLII